MTLPDPDWQSDDGAVRLYCADCMDILPLIPDKSIGLVLTDPPFGVGNFVQCTGRLMGRGDGIGKPVQWNEATPSPDVFDEIRRVSIHRIIWGANFFNCFEERGGAIVWDKNQPMPNFSKAEVASCTHFKKTEVVRIPWTNFEVAKEAATSHPCERPVKLYEWCVQYIPGADGVVLDPFFGSCSTGVACVRLGRQFIGMERERKYFDIAVDRIKEAFADGGLFNGCMSEMPATSSLFDG